MNSKNTEEDVESAKDSFIRKFKEILTPEKIGKRQFDNLHDQHDLQTILPGIREAYLEQHG